MTITKLNKNILVVDDDMDIAGMLKMLLEYKGYDVFIVYRADKVIEALGQNTIALILLDMLIAGSNGTEVCRELRANKYYSHIPLIMISALPNAKADCLEAGADAFIPKPFEMETILSKVHQLINAEQKVDGIKI